MVSREKQNLDYANLVASKLLIFAQYVQSECIYHEPYPILDSNI